MSSHETESRSAKTVDFRKLSNLAGQVFVPSAPISEQQLLAGRIKQLRNVLDTIHAPGQHCVVYGERGVGKTSLVSVVERIVRGVSEMGAVRENCQKGDTYANLWRRALESVRIGVERKSIGFVGEMIRKIVTLADTLPADPLPHHVVTLLRKVDAGFVFIFDEFDQLLAGEAAQAFADTIKALSDNETSAKVILVGVGNTIDELISSHASIERAVIQIQMPRMTTEELTEIIDTRSKELGMTWNSPATRRVVKLSQGLPHYVHRLGLSATRDALSKQSLEVTIDNVRIGMRDVVDSAQQSLTNAYLKATVSQRKDSLFKPVLLACALSMGDELGYFRPASLKRPLREMGHDIDVPVFASHLNKFASNERGNILEKTGTERQWRYRFHNPLIQPYVIIRGIADEDVSISVVDRALTDSEE